MQVRNDKEIILMSNLSIHSFFVDLFNILWLDIKIVATVGELESKIIQISVLSAFEWNNIDVESCRCVRNAAFRAYRPN